MYASMKNLIEITYQEKKIHIAWSFALLDDLTDDVLFSSLSEQECKMADNFKNHSRAKEFAAGRYCVKEAFALYTSDTKAKNITTSAGVWGYPYIEGSDVNISIAHTDKCVIAVCTSAELPIGIDIEEYKSSSDELIISQLSAAEKKIAAVSSLHSEALHILWASKEAVSKALRTGFRLPMSLFEVSDIIKKQEIWHVYFASIGVLSVIAANTRSRIVALALPAGSIIVNGLDALCIIDKTPED